MRSVQSSGCEFLDIVHGTEGSAASVSARLIMLGTAGGPVVRAERFQPAQVLVVDGYPFVIDCGEAVAHRLVQAGVPLDTIDSVYLTHHHSDHIAGYGSLLLLAWGSGLSTPIDVYGPPFVETMTENLLRAYGPDIETRISDEGRVPLATLIRTNSIAEAGTVCERHGVRVTAALVNHPPVTPALAFRFDTPDRSFVFSGDTTPSDRLIELAQGADVLVHEVMDLDAFIRLRGRSQNADHDSLIAHLARSHTAVEDAGRVAARAGVKILVLTHFVPNLGVSDEQWHAKAASTFGGEVVVGQDLMEL